ncbi:MAG: MltA domain-containing protein [Candidatus Aminicenantes bacterium]|nr:MAG: MltA domain-containing protein [Candidatus Aminicenantes bacterium]
MNKKKIFYFFLPVLLILLLVGYFLFFFPKRPVEWTPQNALRPVSAPGISDTGEVDFLARAVDYSLEYFEKTGKETGTQTANQASTMVFFGKDQVPCTHVRDTLLDFKAKLAEYGLSERFFRYVRQHYRFYQSAAPGDVLFTGYFEVDLRGSLTPSEVFRYPLYRKPDDLYRVDLSSFPFFQKYRGLPRVLRGRLFGNRTNRTGGPRIVPYYTREEIDYRQKLAGKGLEIVWIDNPIDVFFLHIQGSGVVALDSGETLRVNYDESNGHPYRAIGRLLVQQDILTLENVSLQSIRDYLEKHPEEMKDIFVYNPSYVFFRVVEEGPMGAIGVPVTPFRSIATDGYLFPKGALCYIETQLPVFDDGGKVTGWKMYSGFALNQDSGGAIRGPGQVDLFTGYGKKSRLIAGHMKQPGTFYFLLKTRSFKEET